MKRGIEIQLRYFDNDVMECQFRCNNGGFAGWADTYLEHESLDQFAAELNRFPTSRSDTRSFEFGTFDPKYAGGGISFHFYCTDSAGHAAVDVRLRGDGSVGLGEAPWVALRVTVEAAGIDSFVQQLKGIKLNLGATAFLPLAGLGELE
jgi:hypothetical protein